MFYLPLQAFVATIWKFKARAGTIFRNGKKSNDKKVPFKQSVSVGKRQWSYISRRSPRHFSRQLRPSVGCRESISCSKIRGQAWLSAGAQSSVNQRRDTADGVQTPWTSYIHRRYRGRARRSVDKKWLTLHPSPRRSPYTGTRCPYAVLHCYTIAYATLRTTQNIFGVAPWDGQRRGSVATGCA